jgi:hypothetical protein
MLFIATSVLIRSFIPQTALSLDKLVCVNFFGSIREDPGKSPIASAGLDKENNAPLKLAVLSGEIILGFLKSMN